MDKAVQVREASLSIIVYMYEAFNFEGEGF